MAKPPTFTGKMEDMSAFINTSQLYLSIKMTGELKITKIAWMLSYVQRGVVEAWKNNILDELSQGISEVSTATKLFAKMRNEFEKTAEEEKKTEQLRTIEQESRTHDKYVQEFKKVARESDYERGPLIEKFKRRLNKAIRRKLAEAESLPDTITEWQER